MALRHKDKTHSRHGCRYFAVTTEMQPEHVDVLDARGLVCPLPVLKAQKRLKSMAPGMSLLVLCTDPKAPADLNELAAERGYQISRLADGTDCTRIVLTR